MKCLIYKLHFTAPIHFGRGELSDSEYNLCSDTFISALCTELAGDEGMIGHLIDCFRDGNLLVSDAFPYISDKLFLPKPYILIDREQKSESSVLRKAYKKLKYIPLDLFEEYLKGDFDVLSAPKMSDLGVSSLKISASIRNEDEITRPYEVGIFSFNSNCGLYLIVKVGDDQVETLLDQLIYQVSLSGIGGKRSSGYGRFIFEKVNAPERLEKLMCSTEGLYVLLNTALPQETELERVVANSGYGLVKRSGFVTSFDYSSLWRRRKDMYMFKSGSCFIENFEGDVFDISDNEGSHPVFRFGKPLFMRVTI